MSDATSQFSTGGFDMLQKMWEAFSPSAAFQAPLSQLMQHTVPLVDPAELDKRIAEMRAVEQWLTLNANMLRSTIQAFEVQRATYATLKAFGESFTRATPSSERAAAGRDQTSESPQAAPGGAAEADRASGQSTANAEAAGDHGEGAARAASQVPPFFSNTAAYGAFDPAPWWNALRSQFDQIAAAAQASAPSMPPNFQPPPAAAPDGKKRGSTKAGGRSRAKRGTPRSPDAEPRDDANDEA